MRGFLGRLGHMLGEVIVSFGLGPTEPLRVVCEMTTTVAPDLDSETTFAPDVDFETEIGHC